MTVAKEHINKIKVYLCNYIFKGWGKVRLGKSSLGYFRIGRGGELRIREDSGDKVR